MEANRSETSAMAYRKLEPCFVLRFLGLYLIVLWCSGIWLNGKILRIFIQKKKFRRSSSHVLILGLILADFVPIIFEMPISIISTVSCRWFFGRVGCIIEAFSAFFTGSSNLYVFVLISIDRLLLIRYPHSRKLFTVRRACFGIGLSYAWALFWAALPLFGWSDYDFEGAGVSCSIKWQRKSLLITSYLIAIFFAVFLLPMVVMIVVNWQIVSNIKGLSNKSISATVRSRHRIQRHYRVQRRVTFTIMIVTVGFFICWFPYAVMMFIGGFIDPKLIPPVLNTILAILTKTSFVWNSFVYVMRNRSLRRQFFTLHRLSTRHIKALPDKDLVLKPPHRRCPRRSTI